MDLFAYMQIKDIEPILKENGIVIPRSRGYRYMAVETPTPKESMKHDLSTIVISEGVKESFNDYYYDNNGEICGYSPNYKKEEKYMIERNYSDGGDIVRWDKLHGKLRKRAKYFAKQAKKRYLYQNDMFNKYCGREDVIYCHCKWADEEWNNNFPNQPWCLDWAIDWWDCARLDIYIKIDPKTILTKCMHRNEDGSSSLVQDPESKKIQCSICGYIFNPMNEEG